MNKSIPTSTSVEFVSLTPLNPLISKCEIKVLYTGLNRNKSFITKDVANKMAQSLPGTPIVGEFLTQDFGDHGEEDLVIDENGLRFVKSTVPYGFIPTDAKIWWQNFLDCDGVEREYLLTEGYLWTGRYPETQRVISKGNGQSMELDRDSLVGEWTKSDNAEFEYFNIDEAFFSALCILGEDVEPCFEGSSITAPEVSKTFTKMDDNFKKTLYAMMQDLKFALEGGQKMIIDEAETKVTEPEVVETEAEITAEETSIKTEATVEEETTLETEESSEDKDTEDQSVLAENDNSIEDQSSQENFTKADDKDEEEESKDANDSEEDSESEEEDDEDKEYKCGGSDKKEKSYSLLETELAETKAAYADLEQKYQVLVEFKKQIDNEKKDALINSFYMLSDEDKADVIENKSNYSLDEIESKLSVICVRKRVNFDLEDTSKKEEEVVENVTTYNMNDVEPTTPAWIAAIKNTRNSKK